MYKEVKQHRSLDFFYEVELRFVPIFWHIFTYLQGLAFLDLPLDKVIQLKKVNKYQQNVLSKSYQITLVFCY